MIPAKQVLRSVRQNAFSRWSGEGENAEDRINSRIVVPQGIQRFTAAPGMSFFAVGSCFARNVEEQLEQAGARVTSRTIAVRDLGDSSARQGGMFNKYTPVSILQELRWAAGLDTYPPEALLPLGNGEFYDPYLSGKAGRGSQAELLARREEVRRYFAQIFEADVAIITLGLIESWTDLNTGLALNETPDPKFLARNAERFGFEQLSLEQCEAALEQIMDILRRFSKPGQRKILTVSPVALGRTFTDEDVILANMTSKSTLRIAATRLIARCDDVDYFASYEAVMLSDPALSWQRDRRHVSDVVVGQIIRTFLQRYGISNERPEDLEAARAALRQDKTFQTWAERAGSDEELLARLNREVNKYKNMVIKLQKELRLAQR